MITKDGREEGGGMNEGSEVRKGGETERQRMSDVKGDWRKRIVELSCNESCMYVCT